MWKYLGRTIWSVLDIRQTISSVSSLPSVIPFSHPSTSLIISSVFKSHFRWKPYLYMFIYISWQWSLLTYFLKKTKKYDGHGDVKHNLLFSGYIYPKKQVCPDFPGTAQAPPSWFCNVYVLQQQFLRTSMNFVSKHCVWWEFQKSSVS